MTAITVLIQHPEILINLEEGSECASPQLIKFLLVELNLSVKDGILIRESISRVLINEAVLTLVSPSRIHRSKQLVITVVCLIALIA